MHIFLQGERGIGKSTVIRKTLEMLTEQVNITLGGFFTWNGGNADPNIYIRAARTGAESEIFKVAGYDASVQRMVCDTQVFETIGTRILQESAGADMIIMDELGYLESSAEVFKKNVLDTLAENTPVFGVLRLGDVPWHREVKNNPQVTIYDVEEKNRSALPQVLSGIIRVKLQQMR